MNAQKEQEKLERQAYVRRMAKYREYFQTGAIIFILSVMIVVGLLIWLKYVQDSQITDIASDISVEDLIDGN